MWWKNYFTWKRIILITPLGFFLFFFFFLWLENIVISNYNKYSKLTFTQKIKEPLSTRSSILLVAQLIEISLPKILNSINFIFFNRIGSHVMKVFFFSCVMEVVKLSLKLYQTFLNTMNTWKVHLFSKLKSSHINFYFLYFGASIIFLNPGLEVFCFSYKPSQF